MGAMGSQINGVSIVYSTVCSGTDQGNIKAPRQWPLWVEFTGDHWITVTRASNVEYVSISWRHHDYHELINQIFAEINVTIAYITTNSIMLQFYTYHDSRPVVKCANVRPVAPFTNMV